jgi:hypothetical protein
VSFQADCRHNLVEAPCAQPIPHCGAVGGTLALPNGFANWRWISSLASPARAVQDRGNDIGASGSYRDRDHALKVGPRFGLSQRFPVPPSLPASLCSGMSCPLPLSQLLPRTSLPLCSATAQGQLDQGLAAAGKAPAGRRRPPMGRTEAAAAGMPGRCQYQAASGGGTKVASGTSPHKTTRRLQRGGATAARRRVNGSWMAAGGLMVAPSGTLGAQCMAGVSAATLLVGNMPHLMHI